jgi:dTDP-glucose pyrophosphorylase
MLLLEKNKSKIAQCIVFPVQDPQTSKVSELDIFIYQTDSVREALKKLNASGTKILLVVDEEDKLLGTVSDGDVRRFILSGSSITDPIEGVYNRKPLYIKQQDFTEDRAQKTLIENRVELLPLVNTEGKVVDFVMWDQLFSKGQEKVLSKPKIDIPVVIMAGGEGTRLDPFTRILPKPLIPVGEKTIIEIIMDKFGLYGVDSFCISINHKSQIIKAYFEEIKTKYSVKYIEEEIPLGTAGSLKFLHEKIKDSLLVSNCDIIVDCDYSELIAFHNDNSNDVSIVGSMKHFTVPYGVCEIENGGVLRKITEKPEYDFLVNTGMYILRKGTLDLIPPDRQFHITDLIEKVKDQGGKVGVYPISEKSWIDVGQWDEYRKSLAALGFQS